MRNCNKNTPDIDCLVNNGSPGKNSVYSIWGYFFRTN